MKVPMCTTYIAMLEFDIELHFFYLLKEHCHEDFAVLGQFCAKIITLSL